MQLTVQWTIVVREDYQKKLKLISLEFVQCSFVYMLECLYCLIWPTRIYRHSRLTVELLQYTGVIINNYLKKIATFNSIKQVSILY